MSAHRSHVGGLQDMKVIGKIPNNRAQNAVCSGVQLHQKYFHRKLPFYNVAPVVRDDVIEMYPQIPELLNKVSPKITNEEISALNWEVAGKGRDAQDVADEWLKKQGLIK